MTYYLHKVCLSSKNLSFNDGKIWPGSGSARVHISLSPWIRVRIEVNSWIQIRTETTADPQKMRKMKPTLYLPALILQQVAERWKPLLLGCSLFSPSSNPLPHIKLILSTSGKHEQNKCQPKKLGVLVYKLYHHFKSKRHMSFVLRKAAGIVCAQTVFFFNKQVSKACGNHTLFRT